MHLASNLRLCPASGLSDAAQCVMKPGSQSLRHLPLSLNTALQDKDSCPHCPQTTIIQGPQEAEGQSQQFRPGHMSPAGMASGHQTLVDPWETRQGGSDPFCPAGP